jgi:hypothetical protein
MEEFLGRNDADAGIVAEREQIAIAADDILDARGDSASDDLVVVRVAWNSAHMGELTAGASELHWTIVAMCDTTARLHQERP